MTPGQCKAGRALLGINQEELASDASVGVATLRNFEAGRSDMMLNNIRAIETVFQLRGVEFTEDDKSVGVLLRKDSDMLS